MDWIKQLNEVMDYIDDNLQGEISNDKIAQIACCSIYNFQRIFSYIAQTSMSEYIRNRRLTLAAFDIIRGSDRIIDLALKYGYDSQDAFSRAFSSFHGVLPSVVRKEPAMVKSCPKLSFQIMVKGAEKMNYQIERWSAFKVFGISNIINTEKSFEIVPQIWDKAWKSFPILLRHGRLSMQTVSCQRQYKRSIINFIPNGCQVQAINFQTCLCLSVICKKIIRKYG